MKHLAKCGRSVATGLLALALSAVPAQAMITGGEETKSQYVSRIPKGDTEKAPAGASGAGREGAPGPLPELKLATSSAILHRDVAPHLLAQLPPDLSGNLRGADLRGRNLRGLDLSGKDLTGADLRDADLRRANLSGANLTRAKLAGAVLYEAWIQGAVGLDLAACGARLHPFFEVPAGMPFGSIALMDLPWLNDLELDPPADLGLRQSTLVWRSPASNRILMFQPSGATYSLKVPDTAPLTGLAADPDGALWLTAKDRYEYVSADQLATVDQGRPQLRLTMPRFPESYGTPVAVAAGAPGMAHFWFETYSLACQRGTYKGQEASLYGEPLPSCCRTRPGSRVASDPQGRYSAMVHPDEDAAMVHLYEHGKAIHVHLDKGDRPSDVVVDDMGRSWIALSGSRKVMALDPVAAYKAVSRGKSFNDGRVPRKLPEPPGAKSGTRGPLRLALDRAGRLWFADPEGGCLGWVDRDGKGKGVLPLPDGLRPGQLVACPDGRMVFTLEGQPMLGMVVTANPPGAASETKAAAPAKPTGKERRERHYERERRAYQRYLAALDAEAKEEAGPDEEVDAKAEAKGEDKTLAAEDAPALRLSDLGVTLLRPVNRSIRWKHCNERNLEKSQFAPEFHSPEALAKLLADGLEGSGVIGRILSTDGSGRFLTRCRLEDGRVVGHLGHLYDRQPTRTFLVVTERTPNGTGYDYDVVTAFPVADTWGGR